MAFCVSKDACASLHLPWLIAVACFGRANGWFVKKLEENGIKLIYVLKSVGIVYELKFHQNILLLLFYIWMGVLLDW